MKHRHIANNAFHRTGPVVGLLSGLFFTLASPVSADSQNPLDPGRMRHIDSGYHSQPAPRDLKRARYLYRRIDVNDDGRIGPRERRYARRLKNQADLNGDGRIGKKERHAVRHTLNQVDRRY